MIKIIKLFFWLGMFFTSLAIVATLTVYLYLKPSLPEISLVDQSQLQIPLKIYTNDGVLIGEFGEKKRRPISYEDIPENLTGNLYGEMKNVIITSGDKGFLECDFTKDITILKT